MLTLMFIRLNKGYADDMITSKDYEVKTMASMPEITLENKSDVVLNGVAPGGKVRVKVDRDGTPLDRYWRNRLRDAAIDGCVAKVVEPARIETKNEKAGK